MIQVSVLVAAYNAANTLPKCLNSLRAQTLTDIELLCVDDCSSDNTYQLLRMYAEQDARIRVLRTPVNSGQAVARNMALNFVHAPFVCMVDADDWLSSDCLKKALHVFESYPKTDCVPFRLIEVYEDGTEREYGLPKRLQNGGMMSGQEAFDACLDGWKLHGLYLTRTSLHKQIPFDNATRLYSDDNTSRLHYLHSCEVRACDGIYFYRKHAASMTTRFNLHRFDFMEANLSLRSALLKEQIPTETMQRFEGTRWMTFIACYRLYLEHEAELTADERHSLHGRFQSVLKSFSSSSLLVKYRWRPGYMFMTNLRLFDAQQRFYRRLHTYFRKNS